MAEGVEYEELNLDTTYFCHQCSREVEPSSTTDLVCPECCTGFLEEMSKALLEIDCGLDIDTYFDDDLPLGSFGGRGIINRLYEEVHSHPESDSDTQEESDVETSLVNSFVEFMQNAQPLPFQSQEEHQVMRMRYFEDYNGDADVDAVASQLLDEVEISGPPPLSKDQIKALPLVTLSSKENVGDSQCTVCMNDFKVGDKAKQLTCEHLFHEKCITPWLERQASCPNCRSTIKVESKNKRSLSCPRTALGNNLRARPTNQAARRFSDASSLGDFFTTSMNMNPFRFL